MADLSLQLGEDVLGTPDYGDLLMVNGDVALTSPTGQGTDATVQLLTQRLRLFVGEWFMSTNQGVPYYQTILRKGATASEIDAAIKDCILGCPGVQALLSYQGTAYRAQRIYRISFTIVTATGVRVTTTVPVGG